MSNQMKAVMKNWMSGLAMLGIVIGTVHIPKAAVANGAGLPAGTYTMRVSDEQPTVPVGQAPDAEKWIEFVQGGKVVAKEMASVVTDAVMAAEVADRGRPKPNQTWLQTLKGGDYYRVWVNKGGNHYLVNLAIGKPVVK
jgi:hypothetical protein